MKAAEMCKDGLSSKNFYRFNSLQKHLDCLTVDKFGEHKLTFSEKEWF